MSDRREGESSFRPRSMAASSTRDGWCVMVEVTITVSVAVSLRRAKCVSTSIALPSAYVQGS
jgi:hypothetical protein